MIYGMKLHQSKGISNEFRVVRVPGGWIYHLKFYAHTTAVFVPFDNEFDGHKEKYLAHLRMVRRHQREEED